MFRASATFVFLGKAVFHGVLLCGLLSLSACGENKEDKLKWKLNSASSIVYSVSLIGTARMDSDLFNYEREKLLINGAPIKISLREEIFALVQKKGGSALNGEYVTGPTSYVSFPDAAPFPKAHETLEEIFNRGEGISIGKFEVEEKGIYRAPDVSPFLPMKILMRMPEADTLEKKQGLLPRMGITEEQLCLSLHNRKIASSEQYNNITLNRLSVNTKNEVLADLRYVFTERLETERKGGDYFRRRLFKIFNDGNLLGNRPLPEDDDNVQKIYICKYKGRHIINLTRGWVESITADETIEVIKMLDSGPKAVELLRAKIKMTPTDKRIKAIKNLEDMEMLELLSSETTESEEDDPKGDPEVTEKLEDIEVTEETGTSPAPETHETLELPSTIPSGNALPDPDIDSQ